MIEATFLWLLILSFSMSLMVPIHSNALEIPEQKFSSDRFLFKRTVSESVQNRRKDIKLHGRSDVSAQHKIIIAVKQSNLDILEGIVNDISDPDSENFGKVMTRDEINTLTNHATSSDYIMSHLKTFFKGKSPEITRSMYGEYISGFV